MSFLVIQKFSPHLFGIIFNNLNQILLLYNNLCNYLGYVKHYLLKKFFMSFSNFIFYKTLL